MVPSPPEQYGSTEDASPQGTLLTIGMLAEQSGLTARTIRYYEELDLIAPARRSTGRYRLYHPRTLKRIRAIVALQDLNFSLDDIAAMLGPSSQLMLVDSKDARIKQSRQSLLNQKTGITQKLALLESLQADLDQRLRLLEQHCVPCAGTDPAQDCAHHCQHREVHVD